MRLKVLGVLLAMHACMHMLLSLTLTGAFPIPAGNTVTHHAMKRFRATKTPIARYLFLRDLQVWTCVYELHKDIAAALHAAKHLLSPTVFNLLLLLLPDLCMHVCVCVCVCVRNSCSTPRCTSTCS